MYIDYYFDGQCTICRRTYDVTPPEEIWGCKIFAKSAFQIIGRLLLSWTDSSQFQSLCLTSCSNVKTLQNLSYFIKVKYIRKPKVLLKIKTQITTCRFLRLYNTWEILKCFTETFHTAQNPRILRSFALPLSLSSDELYL